MNWKEIFGVRKHVIWSRWISLSGEKILIFTESVDTLHYLRKIVISRRNTVLLVIFDGKKTETN